MFKMFDYILTCNVLTIPLLWMTADGKWLIVFGCFFFFPKAGILNEMQNPFSIKSEKKITVC